MKTNAMGSAAAHDSRNFGIHPLRGADHLASCVMGCAVVFVDRGAFWDPQIVRIALGTYHGIAEDMHQMDTTGFGPAKELV